jgi:hypothetical protein
MKFSLKGVGKLKSPVVVDGRTYTIKKRSRMIDNEYVASFVSPNGLLIEMNFGYWDEMSDGGISLRVDGQEIADARGYTNTFSYDTEEIVNVKLRELVEQAITDLETEEVRLDPTGRYAQFRDRQTQREASLARQEEILRKL